MVKCPECGKKYPVKSENCPNCGAPNKKFKKRAKAAEASAEEKAKAAEQKAKSAANIEQRAEVKAQAKAAVKKNGTLVKVLLGIIVAAAVAGFFVNMSVNAGLKGGTVRDMGEVVVIPTASKRYAKGMSLERKGKFDEAAAMFRRGYKERNCAWCIAGLGDLLVCGLGTERDPEKGIELLKTAHNAGVPLASLLLGSLLIEPKFEDVKQDTEAGVKYLEHAINLGKAAPSNRSATKWGATSAKTLAEFYEKGGALKQDKAKALEYYKLARDMGGEERSMRWGLKDKIAALEDPSSVAASN